MKVSQDMDQRIIVAYLDLKGMSAPVTHEDVLATLGANAAACNSATRDLREAGRLHCRKDPTGPHCEGGR
jgi:hypothetical protein